jgi:hypothetical protein
LVATLDPSKDSEQLDSVSELSFVATSGGITHMSSIVSCSVSIQEASGKTWENKEKWRKKKAYCRIQLQLAVAKRKADKYKKRSQRSFKTWAKSTSKTRI